MEVEVRAEVKPTESSEKVLRALHNIFDADFCEEEAGYIKLLVGRGGGEVLLKLWRLLREQRILDAARQHLVRGKRDRGLTFYLNKQAAYMGRVSFCTFEYGESPLGSIVVDVETEDPDKLILWLAPRTVHGSPVEEVSEPPDP